MTKHDYQILGLCLQKLAKKEKTQEFTVSVTTRNKESATTLASLLCEIGKAGNNGHSFDIVVDPDDKELSYKTGWDGDGADSIRDVLIDGSSMFDAYVSKWKQKKDKQK